MFLYQYPFGSFPGAINLPRLVTEIQQSTIAAALDHADESADSQTVGLWFKAELSGGDKLTLDGIVAAHSGVPLGPPTTADGVPVVHMDSPTDAGKVIVVPSPAREGWTTLFVGAADDPAPTPPATGRGTGTPMVVAMADAGVGTVELQFVEPVEMHDGGFWTEGTWAIGDTFDMSIEILATPLTPNPGLGNCNLVDLGGGLSMIVPASGDGSHDVVLSAASPVPDYTGSGRWCVDRETGVVRVPSATDTDRCCNLFDFPMSVYFLRRFPMGRPTGCYDFEVYKAEWISPKWTLKVVVNKVSAGAGKLAGWLMTFRARTD